MKNTKKHWCKWCGEKSSHTSDKHVYEDELVKLKKVNKKTSK